MNNFIEFLQRVDLFSLLAIDEINIITKNLHPVEIDKDEIIFKEGDEGNELFIVTKGKVASYVVLPTGNKREIAVFSPGDFFGEMSIFENSFRSATCYAKDKSHLLSFKERDIFELILYNPEVAVKIMYKMLNITTERLLDRSEFLSDMVQWGEEARKRAITDELTGIYNRHFLDDALEDYFERSKDSKKPLTLVMIDIDNFKQFSENYDQNTINNIIKEIVNIFRYQFREKDIIARYGGDEFTVIMPDTNIEEASEICRRICASISRLDFSKIFKVKDVKVTISQGIASFPDNAVDLDGLRKAADQALYKAKLEGKDRVVCAARD